MTTISKGLGGALAAAAISGWSSVAIADHFNGTCADELNAVEMAINAGRFTGKKAESDRTNLLAKLGAADRKIELNKYSDAVSKLEDISNTATALANAQPNSKLDSAENINEAVIDAIICVPNER